MNNYIHNHPYRLKDFIQFNPKEKLPKGTIARKITMEQLSPNNRYVESNIFEEFKGGSKFRNGDTIMARITPCLENGKTAYITSLNENELAFGSTEFIVFREIEGKSNSKYLLKTPQIRDIAIKSMVGSSGRQRVQQNVLENYEVLLPTLDKQIEIANILSSLDDKIELNRRINENLEQQAQALFKSWFVDFEPFKDGKFVDSELGMIPEGWKVIETNKFMTISKESINPSKNPNCFYAHYSIPAFDEKSMPIFQYGNEIKSNKQKVSDNMTLVSKLNPRIKRIWFIDKACENAICSTEFIPYISLNNSPYFLYCYLDSDVFYNSIMSSVNGATGSHQRFQANDTLKFLFPYNEEVIYKFNLVVSGILKHKSRLIIESQKLSQLRNTLLPRLMSGELEIKDNSYD